MFQRNRYFCLSSVRDFGVVVAMFCAGVGGLVSTLTADTPTESAASAPLSESTTTSSGRPPNLLFILVDDFSYDLLSEIDRRAPRTPNLDRLARQGVRFSHTYNMGSWTGAVCIASRTMLNTGRFLWRAEAVHRELDREREAGRLWPQYLGGAGYETYFAGKWHVNTAPQQVFDFVRHVRPGMPTQTPEGYDRPRLDRPDQWRADDPKRGGFWEGGKHWSEVTADDGIHFLQQAQSRTAPFFIYLAFNAPHDPRQAPPSFLAQYDPNQIVIPPNFLTQYPYADQIGCGRDLRDEQLAPFPRTEQAVRVHRQEYFACVSHLDAQIGRVLDVLAQSEKAHQTLVIFSADHGLAVGQHGLMGKQNMYDHSLRVPMIVAGPNVPENEVRSAPIYLQDVMPTTLEIAGVPLPDHVDFRSFLAALPRDSAPNYDSIYGAYLDLQRAVVQRGWKLVAYPKANKLRLFDLTHDPHEQHDLSDVAEHQALKDGLLQALYQQQLAMGDRLDLKSIFGTRP